MSTHQSQTPPLHSIQQVARASGVSSRTLRYYDQINLLPPAAVDSSGQRLYGSTQLVRLQRILLLRATGLELRTIGAILDEQQDERKALAAHIQDLRRQRDQLDQRIRTLQSTIERLDQGGEMNPNESFEGFNEQYKDEVTQRWGAESYRQSDRWWRSLTDSDRGDFMQRSRDLTSGWVAAGAAGIPPESPEAQELAEAHARWLSSIPGTPAATGDPEALKQYMLGLAQLYVDDERFAANYQGHAQFVHDALEHYVARH